METGGSQRATSDEEAGEMEADRSKSEKPTEDPLLWPLRLCPMWRREPWRSAAALSDGPFWGMAAAFGPAPAGAASAAPPLSATEAARVSRSLRRFFSFSPGRVDQKRCRAGRRLLLTVLNLGLDVLLPPLLGVAAHRPSFSRAALVAAGLALRRARGCRVHGAWSVVVCSLDSRRSRYERARERDRQDTERYEGTAMADESHGHSRAPVRRHRGSGCRIGRRAGKSPRRAQHPT